MKRFVTVVSSFILLASCGGGGGGGSSSVGVVSGAPTPAPAPAPTPTPTPTAVALNTGEVKPTADSIYLAATMMITTTGGVAQTNGVITSGMTSNRTTIFDTPSFAASYDAVSGYRLSDSGVNATFGRDQFSNDTTDKFGKGLVLFTNISGQTEDYLALYQSGVSTSSSLGSGSTLGQYGGRGGWQHTTVSGNTRQTRLTYFAYGSPTPASAMPRSGQTGYSILSSGNYAADDDLLYLSARSDNSLFIDYSNSFVRGSISLSGQNFFKGESGGFGGLVFEGKIVGNTVNATITSGSFKSHLGITGKAHLVFIGPTANEVIVTYVASDAQSTVVGNLMAVYDPYITRQ